MAPAEAVSTDAGQRLLLEARNEGNWGGGRWGWRPRLAGAHAAPTPSIRHTPPHRHQDAYNLIEGPDSPTDLPTAVAVGVARLCDSALDSAADATPSGGAYRATGRAPSAAAGRLSYMFGLKVSALTVEGLGVEGRVSGSSVAMPAPTAQTNQNHTTIHQISGRMSGHRHRLLLLPGGGALGHRRPACGGVRGSPSSGRQRAPDAKRGVAVWRGWHAGVRRAVQGAGRRGGRLWPGGGVRRAAAQASGVFSGEVRGGGRFGRDATQIIACQRPPMPAPAANGSQVRAGSFILCHAVPGSHHPGDGRQPGRPVQRAHRAQRPGTDDGARGFGRGLCACGRGTWSYTPTHFVTS